MHFLGNNSGVFMCIRIRFVYWMLVHSVPDKATFSSLMLACLGYSWDWNIFGDDEYCLNKRMHICISIAYSFYDYFYVLISRVFCARRFPPAFCHMTIHFSDTIILRFYLVSYYMYCSGTSVVKKNLRCIVRLVPL